MQKFITFLAIVFTLIGNTKAKAADIEKNTESCAPQYSQEDTSDLVMRDKYIDACQCLEKQILQLAKERFSPEYYQQFSSHLATLSAANLRVLKDINERAAAMENLPGTLDMLQTQMDQYEFLQSLLLKLQNQNLE